MYMTLTAAADFQCDKNGLARLCKGLNVRGVRSSPADCVALQYSVFRQDPAEKTAFVI